MIAKIVYNRLALTLRNNFFWLMYFVNRYNCVKMYFYLEDMQDMFEMQASKSEW